MKKAFLKVFGVAALAAGMMYNVQMSDYGSSSDISLAALGNVAVAQSEGGSCCVGSTFRISPISGGWSCNQGGSSCCPVC